MHCRRSSRGLTLIELMIVIAIIVVLAAVALPSYWRYQLRSKSSEATINMGAIRTMQESFATVNDQFANITTVEGNTALTSNKAPWPATSCNAACSKTNAAACTEFECIGYKPHGQVYYAYQSLHVLGTAAASPDFCIGAQGDLDGDGSDYGEFEFQSDGGATGAGVVDCTITSCAVGQVPTQILNCNQGQF